MASNNLVSEMPSGEAPMKVVTSNEDLQVLESVPVSLQLLGDSSIASSMQNLSTAGSYPGQENNQPRATMEAGATQSGMDVKPTESYVPVQVGDLETCWTNCKRTGLDCHDGFFQSDLLKLQNSIHQMEERGMTSDPRYFQAKQLLMSLSAR
jgi:hypothetical protein